MKMTCVCDMIPEDERSLAEGTRGPCRAESERYVSMTCWMRALLIGV